MKVHLVDGTYELFRAYFGGEPAKNSVGRDVGAVRTLASSLLFLLRDRDVTHVGCAFDHVIRSFRNDLFDGYKTEEGVPEDLLSQFDLAERASEALGFGTWPMVEFEADDALATMARIAGEDPRVEQVVICSPDKDMAQCISSEHVIGFDRMRKKTLDEPGVLAKFGVSPASIPDFLALVGDSADGIPGVTGFGAKSAAAVLFAYGTIDAIPTDSKDWSVKVRGAERLAASLNAARDDAKLYKTLATLRTDVPLGTTVDELEWHGPRLDLLKKLARELSDESLVARATRVRDERQAENPPF